MTKLRTLAFGLGLLLAAGAASASYVVNVYESSAPSLTTLAQADALIAGGQIASQGFYYRLDLDDLGDFTTGIFSLNQAWPGSANTTFAAHVQGTFLLEGAGPWVIGINHDDGARLTVDGIHTVIADGLADNRNTFLSALLGPGVHTVDIVFFENGGGASLELIATSPGAPLVLLVPEPAMLALFGLALAACGFASSRWRRG